MRLRSLLGFAIPLTALYLVTRYCLPMFYTPEWGARHLLIPVALIICAAAAFGKHRFAVTACGGYLLGLILGEGLGKVFIPANDPCNTHYGWLILLTIFLISCLLGLLLQRKPE